MESLPLSTVQQDLASALDRVCQKHEPLVITRGSEPAVVMLPLADFESLEETAYLLSSPANARRLLDSITEIERGGGTIRNLAPHARRG